MGREDEVLDLRFLKDQKTFRATYKSISGKNTDEEVKHFWIDVNLASKKISIRNGSHYCDKSVLALKEQFDKVTQMKEDLLVLIKEELHVGNKI
jgi:L-rhamnose isomerase